MKIKVIDLIIELKNMNPEAYVNCDLDPILYFNVDGSRTPFSTECSIGTILAAYGGKPAPVMEFNEKTKRWSRWRD